MIRERIIASPYKRKEMVYNEGLKVSYNAMSYTEYCRWREDWSKYRQWITREKPFDRAEYNNDLQLYPNDNRILVLTNPCELIYLQNIIGIQDFVPVINHEAEHFDEALRLGFRNPFISLFFNYDQDNRQSSTLLVHPGPIPVAMTEQQVVKSLESMVRAPIKLSDGDRYLLGEISYF